MNTVSKYDVADVVKHILGTSETDNAGSGGINGIFGAILAEISENNLEINAEEKVAEGGIEMPLFPSAEPGSAGNETPTTDQLVAHLNTRIFEERVSEASLEGRNFSSEAVGKEFNPSLNGGVVVSHKIERGDVTSDLSKEIMKELTRNTNEASNNKNDGVEIVVKADESKRKETASNDVKKQQPEFKSGSSSEAQKQKFTETAFSRNAELTKVVGDSEDNSIGSEPLELGKNVSFKTTNYTGTKSDPGKVTDESVRVETLRETRPVILGPSNPVPASFDMKSGLTDYGYPENEGDSYSVPNREINKYDDFSPKHAEGIKFRSEGIRHEEPNHSAMVSKDNSFKFDSEAHEVGSGKRVERQVSPAKEKMRDGSKNLITGVEKNPLKVLSSPVPSSSEPVILSPIIRSGAVTAPSLIEQLSTVGDSRADDSSVKENLLKSNNHPSNTLIEKDALSSEEKSPEKGFIGASKIQVSPSVADVSVMKGSKKNQDFEKLADQAQMRQDAASIEKTFSRSEYLKSPSNNLAENSGLNSARPLAPIEANQFVNERNSNNGVTANIDVRSLEIPEGVYIKSRASKVPVSNFSTGMQAAVKGHLSQTSPGNSKFTVSLFPENFGKIEVEVTFSEDAGLNVKMFSDNPEATKLLQQNISTLRESLAFEKVSELVIDSNRDQNSDENFGNEASQDQKLVDVDSESVLSEEGSEEESIDSSVSSNMTEGLDTYV